MEKPQLKIFLDDLVSRFNVVEFIDTDPISVPHSFTKSQDIEIAAFFSALFAWGARKTIIAKSKTFMAMMDNAPYDFIRFHNEHDIRPIKNFKHRTFNFDDALFFIEALKHVYSDYTSLESLFLIDGQFIPFQSLSQFHNAFFTLPFALNRSKKHLSTPVNKSTCKRINMFLRWMVRYDDRGVDFGLWRRISPSDLLIPFDVHVERVALHLNLLSKSKKDWSTVIELTEKLKQLDPEDPIKYDFALFNLGVHAQDYPF